MRIALNGIDHHLPDDCSVTGLLAEAGLGDHRIAIEVNGQIVPRTAHGSQLLREGDRVEIVHALGGG